MAKTEIDRHTDKPQSSYTLLIDDEAMAEVRRIAKAQVRTRSYIVREALRQYLARRNGK